MIKPEVSLPQMLKDIVLDETIQPNPIVLSVIPWRTPMNVRDLKGWIPYTMKQLDSLITVPWWSEHDLMSVGPHGQGNYSFALENAFERGNQGDSFEEIIIKIYQGHEGLVYEIEDKGEGFDHLLMLYRYVNHQGRDKYSTSEYKEKYWNSEYWDSRATHVPKYFINAGIGTCVLDNPWSTTSYNDKGNICRVMYLKRDLIEWDLGKRKSLQKKRSA